MFTSKELKIVFKVKDGYKLELQIPETMKIFAAQKNQ